MKMDCFMNKRDLRSKADVLRALAHSTRLEIVERLLEKPKCVNDIKGLMDVSQPNLSQHLTLLRQEGMVDFCEDGKKRCYYLCRPDFIKELLAIFNQDYEFVSYDFIAKSDRIDDQ